MQTLGSIVRKIVRSARDLRDFNHVSFSDTLGHPKCTSASNKNSIDRRNLIKENYKILTRAYVCVSDPAGGYRKPPEPRGLPLIGTMLSLIMAGGAQKLHEYVDKRHRQLGPIYRERIGSLDAIFVNSPYEFRRIFHLEGTKPRHFLPEAWLLYNDIRKQQRGLLFMDGDEWLYYRTILNKTMLLNPTKLMYTPCQEVAEDLMKKWRFQSSHDVVIENLEYQLYQWSLEVMIATLMGSQWPDCKLQMINQIEYLASMLHQIFKYSVTLSMIPAKLAMKLKLQAWTEFVTTADRILGTVYDLVPKMIQLKGNGLLFSMMKNGILDDDAIRIIGDFVIAAGDTTANTMQWALLLLSSRLELQEMLFDDIKSLSPEKILQHHLIKAVMRETLRLHPVAPFLTRYLETDSFINNYFVSKENLLIMSIYSSGRNENNFPRPNDFLPERWIRTRKGDYSGVKDPYGTLPFAMGARSCIGRKLAETQLILTLAEVIKNFKIECENRDSIEMVLHLISVPSKPIKLKLTGREI